MAKRTPTSCRRGAGRTPSDASEATPAPSIPQGITSWNHARSVVTLNAAPWVVTPEASFTPIAASFSSSTQIPVYGGRRTALTP